MKQLQAGLTLAFTTAVLLLTAPAAFALHPDERAEIENLRQRMQALESEQKEPAKKEEGISILDGKVRLSGLLELEGSYNRPRGGEGVSDLALATAQLGVEASLNDHVGGHIILLHEEGEDQDLVVDEAVLSLQGAVAFLPGTFHLDGGRLYLPFGVFNSHLISDPLTLELGETSDTALVASWSLEERLSFKIGVFSGDTNVNGEDDSIDSWVVSLSGSPVDGITVGASWISDLAESDHGLVTDASLDTGDVPGISAFFTVTHGIFTVEGEYVTAAKRFDDALVAVGEDLSGGRPRAWNLELAVAPAERWEIALRLEGARDFLNDPNRYGAVVSYGLMDHAVIALEYMYTDQRAGEQESSNTVTAQLAVEF